MSSARGFEGTHEVCGIEECIEAAKTYVRDKVGRDADVLEVEVLKGD